MSNLELNDHYKFNDINVHRKIDGLQVLARSWGFVNPIKNIRIKYPFRIKREDSRKLLKGCRTTSGTRYIWTIYLFESSDLTVKVMFWYRDDESLSNMCYKTLSQVISKSISDTIKYFPYSDTSKQNNQKIFPDVVDHNKIDFFEIVCCDFSSFANVFSNYIIANLIVFEQPILFCFLGMCMGQSVSATYIENRLRDFNTEAIIEVLIHHAFDCNVEGKVILWKRDGLINKLDGVLPSSEYYPLALPNLGNFYFELLDTVMANTPNKTNTVTMWKCYGDNSKHVHDNSSKPFQKSEIAEFLLKYASGGFLRNTKKDIEQLYDQVNVYINQIKILDRLVDGASKHFFKAARIELIVSTVDETNIDGGTFPFNFYTTSATEAMRYLETFQLISSETLFQGDNMLVYQRYSEIFPSISKLIQRNLSNMKDSLVYDIHYIDYTMGKF